MLKAILLDEIRFLTFQSVSSDVHQQWRRYLVFGLLFAWLAGIGRYWDNPRADLWQYLGLGSVIYVFVLSGIIYALVAPLRPANWSYRNVLVFVSLTSPPAILYAIPVERFLSIDVAIAANGWFLAVVAAWRVALLVRFLRVVGRMSYSSVLVGTMLPLTLIVITLSMLNLEHVVFELMSGISPDDRSPNDAAFGIVVGLSFYSFLLAPVLATGYFLLALKRWHENKQAKSGGDADIS
ncbi:MAG: hypothetical protein AAF417_11610 [Pseudomonadota bacterium]